MPTSRSGDRNVVGGDRAILDRGYGFKRRGDRWLSDRWSVGGSPEPPATPHLLNGLVSYWKMDEAVNATRNDSYGANHLSDPTGVGAIAAVINNGLNFGNSSLYIKATDNASLQVNGDFTWSGWFYMYNTAAVMFAFCKSNGVTVSDYALWHDPGTGFNFASGTTSAVAVGAPSLAATVYHIVCWYDSSDQKCRMRINDAVTYVGSTTGALGVTPNDLCIGQFVPGASNGWVGVIDEVGFWKRKLTSTEITALYNGGVGLPFSSFTA